MTKKEIISELESKGIVFDASETKKSLELLLIQNTKQTPPKEEEFKADKYIATYVSKGRTHELGTFATINDARDALSRAGAHNIKIKHVTK